MHIIEDVYTSGSIPNLQHLITKSTTKALPTATDHGASSSNSETTEPAASQNEQQHLALQQPTRSTEHVGRESPSRSVRPCDSLQNGGQETSCQQGLASLNVSGIDSPNEPAHSNARVEGSDLQGPGFAELDTGNLTNPHQDQFSNGSLVQYLQAATRSPRPFHRRKPQPWPDPKESLGELIQPKNKKIKGKVWVAQGPALDLFEAQIRPQIDQLLHSTEPPQCAPLLLSIYMIGKMEVSSGPIIMVCCCDRKVRKDAEAIIRDSDILHRFPQIGLGTSATLLETDAFVVPATGGPPASQEDAKLPSSFELYGFEGPVVGRRLKLTEHANVEGREIVRFATGGPFIRIEKHMYQLTAFHIGQDDAVTGTAEQVDSDADDCEYDGQSDTEEDESDYENESNYENESIYENESTMETPLKGSFSTLLDKDLHRSRLHMRQMFFRRTMTGGIPGARKITTDVDRSLFSRSNSDYFLAKLAAGEARRASNSIGNFEDRPALHVTDIGAIPGPRTEVVVVASYSLLTGTILPGITSVKMRGFLGFQDLVAARLSCSIKPGDSGSAVLDASTGCLYGHIILGSAPDTIVYLVPSVNTFTEIVAMFGKLPVLNFGDSNIFNNQVPPGVHQGQHFMSMATRFLYLWKYAKRNTDLPLKSFRSSTSRSGSPQFEEDRTARLSGRARRPFDAGEPANLDPSQSPGYTVHPSSDLKPGNVFEAIWSESEKTSEGYDILSMKEQLGSARKGLKRFIVVENADGHSLCAPIRKYGKHGCMKEGARPGDHGIVYEKGSQPALLLGEPELGFSPVCLDVSLIGLISEEARADYRDLVTVEHDIGVIPIGKVMHDDWPKVQDAVHRCKIRKKAQETKRHNHQKEDKESDWDSLGGEEAAPREYGYEFWSAAYSKDGVSGATEELGRYNSAQAPLYTYGGTEY